MKNASLSALCSVALAAPGVAQYSLDAVLVTDIVSRVEVFGSPPVLETLTPRPLDLGLINSSAQATAADSSAYTNTTILLTESDSSVDATIETFYRMEGLTPGRAAIQEFEIVLNFRTPIATLVRVTADVEYIDESDPFPFPPASRATRIDALNDGTIESSDLESSPYTGVFAASSGVTAVRILPSLNVTVQRNSLGRAITRIKFETVDGCEVSQVSQGCVLQETFRTERLLDGSVRASLHNGVEPSNFALVLGFSSNPIALPPSLTLGATDCFFVPSPDVVLPFGSEGEFSLMPPAGFAPIEVFLQPVGLTPEIVLPASIRVVVLDSYRVACF